MNPTTLLDWATSNMSPSEVPPQQRQWDLTEKKILEAFLRTDADTMKALVQIFTGAQYSLEEKEAALEEIQFCVEQQENAVDFYHPTINGLVAVLNGLKSPNEGIRWRCAWILATMLQNNPKCQEEIISKHGLQKLLEALNWEISPSNQGDLQVLGKLVYAISGLLTYQTQVQKEFWSLGGFSSLVSILKLCKDDLQRFQTKKELIEKPSGVLPQRARDETNEGKADFEIVDMDEKVQGLAETIRNQKQQKKEMSEEEAHDSWVNICGKIAFVLFKIMSAGEQFKLAFIKDKNGEILRTLLHILEQEENLDLKDKVLLAIETMASSEKETMQKYVVGVLKDPQYSLVDILQREKAKLTHLEQQKPDLYDFPGLIEKVDAILSKVQ